MGMNDSALKHQRGEAGFKAGPDVGSQRTKDIVATSIEYDLVN
jgi:hypothetical protein